MANQFGVSKSMIVFQYSIARRLNNYPKIKKSFLSLYFLKNILKIIKDICQENA